MIVTCRQMREMEEAAFARGVSAAALMEEAGKGIARVVSQFFPKPGAVVICLGKGNNAGDALVAARELGRRGWRISARLAFPEGEFKELPARHWRELASNIEPQGATSPLVLLDGLLGIGAAGPLEGPMLELAREMNALRTTRHATTVAMDIPSGLNGDTGTPCEGCVVADITATIAHVKTGLLSDSAAAYVGRLAVVPLPDLPIRDSETCAGALTATSLRVKLPRRNFDFHKGQAGRVGVIAGSSNFTGAAVLTATGALRGGAGLVTLLVKEDVHGLIAAKTPPEIMVRAVKDWRDVLSENYDALAIGPGLGFLSQQEILDVIRGATVPAVIDADALTIIARADCEVLSNCAAPRLLTPHPGEMARLAALRPGWQQLCRRALAEAFVTACPRCVLLLKGSRTVIAQSGPATRFNTTGSPGMATGGMGDVLTGLCAALVAQGVSCFDSGCLGAWLSGRAAEIAITSGAQSVESLTAGDVLQHLGPAFSDLKAGAF